MALDPRELYVREDGAGQVGFGAGTVDNVVALEAMFPTGRWLRDWDDRPTFVVPGLRFERRMEPFKEDGEE